MANEGRLPPIPPDQMTPEQKKVLDAIQSGPRGAGLRGPFHALVRSPELCDLVQRVGAYVRFGTSLPQKLNELAICMAGRKWTAQYEFYRASPPGDRGRSEAGRSLDAVANGHTPGGHGRGRSCGLRLRHRTAGHRPCDRCAL